MEARKGSLGKCETVKRVRQIIKENYGSGGLRWEVGERTNQEAHCFPEGITRKAYWEWYEVSDDGHPADLDDSANLVKEKPSSILFREGTVLHVYVSLNEGSVQCPEWYLHDVLTIWIGTKEKPAVLLSGGREKNRKDAI